MNNEYGRVETPSLDVLYTSKRIPEAVIRKIGFITLETIFGSAIYVISLQRKELALIELIPLALATFRMARTISFNEVGEPLRAPFTEVKKDSCGAGSDVKARGNGLQYVIGSLLACPICSGTWSALVLFALWTLVPHVGKPLVYILATAGLSELLHYSACALEWHGRLSRVTSGHISPDKEE